MVVNKKIPLRKCVATGEMLPKKSMIRVVRSKEGEVTVDITGKNPVVEHMFLKRKMLLNWRVKRIF